jgi:hypothetical protein
VILEFPAAPALCLYLAPADKIKGAGYKIKSKSLS